MKATTMKKIAAAVAAICLSSMAMAPVAASAASIVIKDTNADVVLEDKEFAVYKVFDVLRLEGATDENGEVTYSYVYTVEDAWVGFFEQTEYGLDSTASDFDVQAAKIVTDITTAEGIRAFANKLYDYAEDNGIAALSGISSSYDDTDGEKVTLSGISDAGYYLVADVSTNGGALSAIMMDTAETDDAVVEITLKADQPTITKKIIEGDNRVDANTANIGDVVKYEIKSAVPDTQYYTEYVFKMVDTFAEGLTYQDDVKITIGGNELDASKYTVTPVDAANDGHVEKILIKFLNIKEEATDAEIVVTYSAEVNEDANVGTEGNVNAVKLIYSNNPNESGDGTLNNEDEDSDDDGIPDDVDEDDDNDGTPDDEDTDDDGDGTPDDEEENEDGSTEETPDDKVVTYLTEFKIKKVNDAGEALTGAKFTITADNGYSATDVEVDADGYISVYGVGVGTYTITETQAPQGYNLLTTPVTVEIGCTVTPANGTAIELPDADEAFVFTGAEECAWTYNDKALGANETVFEIEVVNKAGSLFPLTGGMGTTIFIIIGLSMMTAAAVLYIVKRKVTSK